MANQTGINSWPPDGWGESTTLLRENGYQTWECKGRKGISPEPDGVTVPSRWLWIAKAKMRIQAPLFVTCLRWLKVTYPKGKRQAQKGKISDYAVEGCIVSIRKESGVEHHPKVTQNGYTERGNPSTALPALGAGGQAVCPDGRDVPRSKGPG
jgi:hypothetical protein